MELLYQPLNATVISARLLTLNQFAQATSQVTPLPGGPYLTLPSGSVGVLDSGHLFAANHQWVIAVGLSSRVFLAVRERTERYVSSRLLHELLGYLAACDCEVIPLDFRCPLAWRQSGSLESVRGLWARQFFHESDRYLLTGPAIFWRAAGLVADAVAGTPNEPALGPILKKISAAWERRWAQNLNEANITPTDDSLIRQCDDAWASVVQAHLIPQGYEMLPASVTRLL
jgi:hypothetical protein